MKTVMETMICAFEALILKSSVPSEKTSQATQSCSQSFYKFKNQKTSLLHA